MKPLLRGAPATLPLLIHLETLGIAVDRLEGRLAKALSRLGRMSGLEGHDLAAWHRERARALTDLGRGEEAAGAYSEAIAGFGQAGERWEADALRAEAAG